ncbi:MAG: DUF2059 domain-containing protein [Terracidiphilus sp.]
MLSRPTLMILFSLVFAPLAAGAQNPATPPADDVASSSRTISTANKPSREQLITLFDLMRIRSQMQDMLKMVPTAIEQQLQSEEQEVEISLQTAGGGQLTPDQKAASDKVTSKFIAQTANIYPVNEMLTDMVEVYQRHLSSDDVDGIIAFYRSPPGQHLVAAQPLMAQEVMPMVMKKMEARSKDLTDRYRKELNDAMGPPKIPPPQTAPKP